VFWQKRHSPWAEAINVAGWVGVLLPPIWMLALIAAFLRPQTGEGAQIAISQAETTELATAIANISQRLTTLQNNIHALTSGAPGYGSGRTHGHDRESRKVNVETDDESELDTR
jgi:hypothetical protein